IIYVYPTSQPLTTSHTSTSKSWCYIGSANCSESAWGRLVKDRQTKQPKLNCRNWECGVVIPFRRAAAMAHSGSKERTGGKAAEDADKEQSGKDGKAKERSSGLKAFEKVMPVPMKYPGKEYGDGDTPWFNAG
ncbi:MAG: hypothetical protein Q9205_007907, partial [Flavoplaca limonia]